MENDFTEEEIARCKRMARIINDHMDISAEFTDAQIEAINKYPFAEKFFKTTTMATTLRETLNLFQDLTTELIADYARPMIESFGSLPKKEFEELMLILGERICH